MKRYVVCNDTLYDTQVDSQQLSSPSYSTDGKVLIRKTLMYCSPEPVNGVIPAVAIYKDQYEVIGVITREADTPNDIIQIGDYVMFENCTTFTYVADENCLDYCKSHNHTIAIWIHPDKDTLKCIWRRN